MYIKRVQLKRFKQFSSVDFSLKPSLTLVVGANNQGKSSILQALATWQFCKTLLEIQKGRASWTSTAKAQGIGMSINDFTPINVPSLSHLWTNLRTQKKDELDGYTLKIKLFWDNSVGTEKHLEVGLSLANDRLFVKTTETNLLLTDVQDEKGLPLDGSVPEIAYLPPFAGITDKEGRLTLAVRNRLIGQGLSGSVIRNVLYDLSEANRIERLRLKGSLKKIKNSDLKSLRQTDPWEILQRTSQDLFGTELRVSSFNERHQSYLSVLCARGETKNGVFVKYPSFQVRDLMVEGSGFLQWISVYALILSKGINVVLLDEPDAHLHAALQLALVSQLRTIADAKPSQVLLATHSTELIRTYDHDLVCVVRDRKAKYLASDGDKVGVIAGIGGIHSPTLHNLMRFKRLLVLEAESDERFLKLLAQQANLTWPKNVVPWFWPGKASERKQLFLQLGKDIPELRGVSIRDRDDEPDHSVGSDLIDKTLPSLKDFVILKWRRRHIENYLLSTRAISQAAGREESEIIAHLASQGLALPSPSTATDVVLPVRDARGKELFLEGHLSLRSTFNISREDVARALKVDEIADDVKTFFTALSKLAGPSEAG